LLRLQNGFILPCFVDHRNTQTPLFSAEISDVHDASLANTDVLRV